MTRNLHKKTKKRDCHVNFRLELSKPPLYCIVRVIKTTSDCPGWSITIWWRELATACIQLLGLLSVTILINFK